MAILIYIKFLNERKMLSMETIHLSRKKIKKFMFEGKEYILALDSTTVNHYQKANKKGFLTALQEIQESSQKGEVPLKELITLLGSCVHTLTKQPVGVKFFRDYDDFDIVNTLAPQLFELLEGNMPQAKDNTEKK